MNKRTVGWLWIGGILALAAFLVFGGGAWLWKQLLAMHGIH